MSYRSYSGGDRYGSRDDRRHSSSSRRDSPPRHRSRRSPSPCSSTSRTRSPPKPRDEKALPESFGRMEESRTDDDLSVLQRMKSSYASSPLNMLYKYITEKGKVKLWTRNYKEVRGVMTGYVVAFDKHWNVILKDVDEVFLKPKKSKTPFLREVTANENFQEMPAKVPKKKKTPEESQAAEKPPPQPQPPKEGQKKKRPRTKKAKATSEKRHIHMLFVRGDNIVMVSPAEVEDDDDDDEEEEGEASGEVAVKSEQE